jgi:Flp pilus assembly protein TadD
MGLIAQQRGMWDAAASCFRRVVESDPKRTDSLLALGLCCSKAERSAEAIEALKALVAQEPTQAEAWFHLGVCYDKEGDFAKAREAYRRAREGGHVAAVD